MEMSEDLKQMREDYSSMMEELEKERIINEQLMESAFRKSVNTIMMDKKLSLFVGVAAAVVLPIIAYLFSVPAKYSVIIEVFIVSLIAANVVFYRKYDLTRLAFSDVLTGSKMMRGFRKAYIRMTFIVWGACIALFASFVPRIIEAWSTPLKAACALSFLAIILIICLFFEYHYSKRIIDCSNAIIKRLDEFKE